MKNKLILATLLGTGFLYSYQASAATISMSAEGNFIDGVKFDSSAEFLKALQNIKGMELNNSQLIVGDKVYSFPQVSENIQKLISVRDNLSAIERSIDSDPNFTKTKYAGTILNKIAKGPDSDLTSPETQEELKVLVKISKHYNKSDVYISAEVRNIAKWIEQESNKLSEKATKVENQSKLAPFQKPDTLTTDALSASNEAIAAVIDNRIAGFKAAGIAAGDFLKSYGVWIKSLYTRANQKAYDFNPNYKLDQTGIVAGFDVGDDIKIGAAYSFSKSNITSKGTEVKEDIVNHMGIIYGIARMNNQFFASCQGSYGGSIIKKSRFTGDIENNIASGSPRGNIVNGKFEVGYDYKIENYTINIVPTAGIAYNTINVKGYQETGVGLNRKINKRNTSRTSALFGVMTKYTISIGDFAIAPEIHFNGSYIINSKNTATQATIIEGITPLITPASKPSRLKYTIGTSIKLIEHKYLNTEIGYDLGISKKFMSHTGALSFRAEF